MSFVFKASKLGTPPQLDSSRLPVHCGIHVVNLTTPHGKVAIPGRLVI